VTTAKKLKVTLLKSVAGRSKAHQACVRGLGLRRQRHSVIVEDRAEIRGMIDTVSYLLDVKEV
jgi:large subunit ribosomal protein L30